MGPCRAVPGGPFPPGQTECSLPHAATNWVQATQHAQGLRPNPTSRRKKRNKSISLVSHKHARRHPPRERERERCAATGEWRWQGGAAGASVLDFEEEARGRDLAGGGGGGAGGGGGEIWLSRGGARRIWWYLADGCGGHGAVEHYTMRLGAGGGGATAASAQQLSWGGEPPVGPDRWSRFWQMDNTPAMGRIEVICPQLSRPSRLPFLMEPVSRASSKPPNGTLPVYRADSASDILDLILSKNDPDVDTDSGSQAAFFCGSPPVRTNNLVVNDPQFGRNTPSFSPLGSSPFSKMLSGRAEVGSPSCGASSSPKVRIEGFACGNKVTQCAVTFA